MYNLKDLGKGIKQIAEEKGLSPERVLEAVEMAMAAAYKREYRKRGEVVRAKLNLSNGELKFWQVKTVVDENTIRFVEKEEEQQEKEREREKGRRGEPEDANKLPRYNPDRHILIEEAKKLKPDAVVGEELVFPLEAYDNFGRIAAQTAKQIILQELRESERESILSEWRSKEGQIVSGVVQRFERGHVYIDLGRTTGVMFANESIPGEHYRASERLRFLVLAVQEDTRLPGIILSRSHPKFVMKLFELEVPELAEGICEIKAIAREPGSRTKVAVESHADGVDPVGAFVGQRGTRVMAVNNELGAEKIDIIEWSDDPEKFIAHALSPAKVQSVEIMPRREARVYVPEDVLSLAIGRGGQNVRLAAKLSGWKIDVRSAARPEEVQEGGVASTEIGKGAEGEDDEYTEDPSSSSPTDEVVEEKGEEGESSKPEGKSGDE